MIHEGEATTIEPNGLPLGVFCNEHFSATRVHLSPGDTLFLYTDGLTETQNEFDAEYGAERLSSFVCEYHLLPPGMLVSACVEDLAAFRAKTSRRDDLTIMAIRRIG